jgi:large subunit ribosomal protein L25
MAEVKLQVDPRSVTGKKVKSLRKVGKVPAHLYGRETESLALQAERHSIVGLLRSAGANAVIDLQINGEQQPRSVVLRGVQRDPVTDELLHIDFFQISLTEKLRADVPLHVIGEAPGVTVQGGLLLQSFDHLTIEALPSEIPPHIEVDVSGLETIDSALFVRDLALPEGIDLLTDPDQVVVKVEPPKLAAEVEREEAEAAAAAAAAAAPAEGEAAPTEEGEKPAEGAEPAEGGEEKKSE